MNEKTHWKKYTNPNYLGAYAFQPGEEKTVTIKEVKREAVQNQSGTEECTVAHFVEDVKPLILNKTNCKTISKVWGTPYIEDWSGRKITLKVKKISAFGEVVDAVRVSPDRPQEEKIICEDCRKVIEPVRGKTPLEIITTTSAKYGVKICLDCAKKRKENVTNG